MIQLKQFKKEYKFLFRVIIVSCLFSIINFIYVITDNEGLIQGILYSFISFIPAIITCIIAFISYKTFLTHPKITKFVSKILISLILFYQTLVILLIGSIFLDSLDETYTTVKKYPIALRTIWGNNCKQHFPNEIPSNAENIRFELVSNALYFYQNAILEFNIDKKYIDNELKKYKFIGIEKPDNYKHDYSLRSKKEREGIDKDGFVFHIIEEDTEYSLYHCGIGVNDKENKIIYYYINSP